MRHGRHQQYDGQGMGKGRGRGRKFLRRGGRGGGAGSGRGQGGGQGRGQGRGSGGGLHARLRDGSCLRSPGGPGFQRPMGDVQASARSMDAPVQAMDMEDQDACPLCDNHCPADNLGCGKGVAHFRALRAAGR